MSVSPSRSASELRTVVADIAWIVCFGATDTALVLLWNTRWALVLVPVFALMLAGLSELAHHGLHGNLYGRSRRLNQAFGRFGSAILGIDFESYRQLHFEHHRNLATPHDPERDFYLHPAYSDAALNWRHRSLWSKLATIPVLASGMATALITRLHSSAPEVHVLRWGIPLIIGVAGYFEGLRFLIPVKIVVAWYLPITLFVFIDFFLMQSEHYGVATPNRKRRVPAAEQYRVTWNIGLPRIVEFLLMGRNLHAEHHEHPSQHWFAARDKNTDRTISVAHHLRTWWREGPRLFIMPAVVTPLESSSLPPALSPHMTAVESAVEQQMPRSRDTQL